MQQMSEIESDRHFKTTKTLSCLACLSGGQSEEDHVQERQEGEEDVLV